jgi:site-specific recombinase XerD
LECVGADFAIEAMDGDKSRVVKDMLIHTPKHRNKRKETAGKALEEQIELAKKHDYECLIPKTVNKYLSYFSGLFKWAIENNYVQSNPFDGMNVKAPKKSKRKREHFTNEEVSKMLAELSNKSLVKNDMQYWGLMLAIYTGARLNEIASLTVNDIMYDEASEISYISITSDEGDAKTLKTEAAKRYVPIHSALLKNEFMAFVEKRKLAISKKKQGQYQERLLPNLSHDNNGKWGRKLGRWVNESFLPALELKTEKKTLHSLRHSFITGLNAAGVELNVIQSIVGHESSTVTIQNYTHYGLEHLPRTKEAIEKLPYKARIAA